MLFTASVFCLASGLKVVSRCGSLGCWDSVGHTSILDSNKKNRPDAGMCMVGHIATRTLDAKAMLNW